MRHITDFPGRTGKTANVQNSRCKGSSGHGLAHLLVDAENVCVARVRAGRLHHDVAAEAVDADVARLRHRDGPGAALASVYRYSSYRYTDT